MKEILEYQIYHFGQYSLQVHNVVEVFIVVALAKLILLSFTKAIAKTTRIEAGAKYSIRQLIKYMLIFVSILLSVSLLGFDLSVLFVGSAALLVGIGFGLQRLFNNFVSGIIILMDNTIKVNDVIEVDGIVCRVKEIKLRTTTVITREDKFIILPNSLITESKVVNWTYSGLISRFEIHVGIAYNEDAPAVMALLKKVVLQHKSVSKSPEPSIRITKFAESAIEITVMFWCQEVFRVESIKSEIRVAIFNAFREEHIEFAFPQLDVHIVPPNKQ
ncbi:MAG TPA: mechanosensitive ion channel domain-containing protein [Saprospiraceae bacterium]|nr:mechanosensitive ion channel domain-containing protein [Saprospiraceae bacterium]